ncbi:hypothetical protein BST28_17565 [Mycolicibacter kumamotonensis]|uniref:Uncharacterized protein n=1 Tax=Mycolicibacter kumamotonensis TaxID=354243 RepID=A0A1X0DZA2_9MYCO|nr:hypothetical protein [Mycolicibacter kumamotonensis]ORA77611.1 hypothetical protein BST28_17565 [Mycolicibacter kumamotonensis]
MNNEIFNTDLTALLRYAAAGTEDALREYLTAATDDNAALPDADNTDWMAVVPGFDGRDALRLDLAYFDAEELRVTPTLLGIAAAWLVGAQMLHTPEYRAEYREQYLKALGELWCPADGVDNSAWAA